MKGKYDKNDATREENECSVCGHFKFSHEEYCRDCAEYQRRIEEHRRAIARRRHFGHLW